VRWTDWGSTDHLHRRAQYVSVTWENRGLELPRYDGHLYTWARIPCREVSMMTSRRCCLGEQVMPLPPFSSCFEPFVKPVFGRIESQGSGVTAKFARSAVPSW
jgi:hypothetical protein